MVPDRLRPPRDPGENTLRMRLLREMGEIHEALSAQEASAAKKRQQALVLASSAGRKGEGHVIYETVVQSGPKGPIATVRVLEDSGIPMWECHSRY